MASATYLAADLGASSGRVVAGHFDGSRIRLDEVDRFDNGPVRIGNRLHWNILGQWKSIQNGLRAAATRFGGQIQSVGVDTWGVDFGLVGPGNELLGNPVHYRDARTQGILERAFQIVPRDAVFAETGLQFMEFNTAFQLLAMREAGSAQLDMAESLLLMPDLFHWFLTGVRSNELTIASTTHLYNPRTGTWSDTLIERLGLPGSIFGQITAPGTRIGPLAPHVASDTHLAGVDVVLPGSHDTASAVLAVPAASQPSSQPDWCYISSGTWSLMGVEIPAPVVSDACLAMNFTNEGGVDGTTRLLKNIAGLWLVQECRRIWQQQGHDHTWDELVQMAAAAAPPDAVIDPDDPRLLAPDDMPEMLRTLCRESGQSEPKTHGEIIRLALESLAMRYRQVLGMLEQLTGSPIDTIHIVGGGSRNQLLSQMTADATGRRVLTGPVEATAIGNVMLQAIAGGEVASIHEARTVIRQSFEVTEYTPQETGRWDAMAAGNGS